MSNFKDISYEKDRAITLKFSFSAFEHNASASVKKLLPKSHREALDGKSVIFNENGYGTAVYDADGESYYLYPIELSWCVNI